MRAPLPDTDETPKFEAPFEATHAPVGIARRVGAFLLRELRGYRRRSFFSSALT